jgi:hypothetical protein
MIGKLISKTVRTVYEKKVVRLTIDFPYKEMESGLVDEDEMMEWLDNKVGSEISMEVQALADDDQEVLEE